MAALRAWRRCCLTLRCRHIQSPTRRRPKVSDCSPATEERELGSDRGEPSLSYSADELGAPTAIEIRTRVTLWKRRVWCCGGVCESSGCGVVLLCW